MFKDIYIYIFVLFCVIIIYTLAPAIIKAGQGLAQALGGIIW